MASSLYKGYRPVKATERVPTGQSEAFETTLLTVIPKLDVGSVRSDPASHEIHCRLNGANMPVEMYFTVIDAAGGCVANVVAYAKYQAPWSIFKVGLFFPLAILANWTQRRAAQKMSAALLRRISAAVSAA